MPTDSDVPSLIDGLPGRDRFRLLPMSEEPEGQKDLNVEVWHLMKDSNLKEIFGTDKKEQKRLLIKKKKIKELYKAIVDGGNMRDYSMIFLFNYHGRPKVLEVRRTTGLDPHFAEYVITNDDWILSSQLYVLVIPKLA